MSRDLLEQVIIPALGAYGPTEFEDGAKIQDSSGSLVMTTDSHVVSPLEFPGGNIGSLSVHGTTNDLAMMGARPIALSMGLILEEGLSIEVLRRVLESAGKAASHLGVRIVCGDTKVVEHGKGDGIFINTTGIGNTCFSLQPNAIQPGDAIVVSGTVGDHGFTILTQRNGFSLQSGLQSDSASVFPLVDALCSQVNVRWMRDPTRGGVATSLNELCTDKSWGIVIEESKIPLHPAVIGLSEIFGLDPMYSANEGKFLCVIPKEELQKCLDILHAHPLGINASHIGTIDSNYAGKLLYKTRFDNLRVMPMLASDPLPRIC